mmetsp:Transcript_3088/g.8982  ORF Transcript_3088/g.8982 Transcript_3088/m.8982 type:complete len:292 (+) Transcript_3088:38-913(+)
MELRPPHRHWPSGHLMLPQAARPTRRGTRGNCLGHRCRTARRHRRRPSRCCRRGPPPPSRGHRDRCPTPHPPPPPRRLSLPKGPVGRRSPPPPPRPRPQRRSGGPTAQKVRRPIERFPSAPPPATLQPPRHPPTPPPPGRSASCRRHRTRPAGRASHGRGPLQRPRANPLRHCCPSNAPRSPAPGRRARLRLTPSGTARPRRTAVGRRGAPLAPMRALARRPRTRGGRRRRPGTTGPLAATSPPRPATSAPPSRSASPARRRSQDQRRASCPNASPSRRGPCQVGIANASV